jgi:hypothetical protein
MSKINEKKYFLWYDINIFIFLYLLWYNINKEIMARGELK